MSRHLQRDMDRLKKEILQLGDMVETAINNAILSLNDRRPELAELVIEEEKYIDEKEVSIEEDCLKILALHQPVAMDLRFIVVVLKVNNDLERMGDIAVNVAQRALFLASKEPIPTPTDFTEIMSVNIRTMVRSSLDAMVKLDVDLARRVIAMDNEVDDINRQMYVEFQTQVEKDPSTIKRALGLLSTSRNLERIADLATNIAEDVIFMVEGEVVRHK
ncbi:MAG: phosphate signaling complex protein PhoU [Pseudohongiella sp.]|nr:phosphate signaling complex protein PhoU [Pseudohongiella sp.]